VVNFSSVETRFECVGKTSTQAGSRPATIYIKLQTYRWWVGLWSESKGALDVEIPNSYVEYFGHIAHVGDQLQIFRSTRKLTGNFSMLSHTLALATPVGFFDGTCTKRV
jgi:hypothetical protein